MSPKEENVPKDRNYHQRWKNGLQMRKKSLEVVMEMVSKKILKVEKIFGSGEKSLKMKKESRSKKTI